MMQVSDRSVPSVTLRLRAFCVRQNKAWSPQAKLRLTSTDRDVIELAPSGYSRLASSFFRSAVSSSTVSVWFTSSRERPSGPNTKIALLCETR